jgi:hypothetical protein
MFTVINQFKRLRYDDGRNDRSFEDQEERLKEALENLKAATNNLIRASQALSDALILKRPKKLH